MTNFCTANQQQQFYRYFQQHDNNNNNNNDSDNKHDIAGYVPTNVNYNSRIVEQQRRVDSLKEKLLLFDGIGKISEVAAESPLHRSKKESDASDDSIDVDAVFDDDTYDTDGGLLRQQPQLMMPNSSSRQLRMIFSSENVALIQISKTDQSYRKKIESLSRFIVSPTPNALPATTAAIIPSSTTRPLRVIVSNHGSGNTIEACPITVTVGGGVVTSTSPSSSIDSGVCSPAHPTFEHNQLQSQHRHNCNYRLNGANTATTTTTSSRNASSSPPLRPHYSAFFLYSNSGCESAFHHNPYHALTAKAVGGHQHHHHHHIRTSAPCCFPAVSGFPLTAIANSGGNGTYGGQEVENGNIATTTTTSSCMHYTNNSAGNQSVESLNGTCQAHYSAKLSAVDCAPLQSPILPPLSEIRNENDGSCGRMTSPHLFTNKSITTSTLTGGLKGILKKSNIHTCATNTAAAGDSQQWKGARRHQLLRSVSESASSDFIVEKEKGLTHAFSGMTLNSSSKFTVLKEDVGRSESALSLQFDDDEDEFSKTSFEETANNPNSSGHSDSSFNADSSDEKIGDISPRKKRVSFSEHVQARIYRSNSSILGQKKRTERKNRQKRRRSESENCNADENNASPLRFSKQRNTEADKKITSSENDINNCHICGKLRENRRCDSRIENDTEEEKSVSTDEVNNDKEAENKATRALERVSLCVDCRSASPKKKTVGDDKLAKRIKHLVSANSALGEEETSADVHFI